MDHGVSSRLALSAPSNSESKSPRVKRAKTDPSYGAFTVGYYQPPDQRRDEKRGGACSIAAVMTERLNRFDRRPLRERASARIDCRSRQTILPHPKPGASFSGVSGEPL